MDMQCFKIVVQWRLDKITLSLLPNPRDEKPERNSISLNPAKLGLKAQGILEPG